MSSFNHPLGRLRKHAAQYMRNVNLRIYLVVVLVRCWTKTIGDCVGEVPPNEAQILFRLASYPPRLNYRVVKFLLPEAVD